MQKEILSLGVRCESLEIDLMNEQNIDLLFETAQKKLGSPTVLINNATYSTITEIENIAPQELDKHY